MQGGERAVSLADDGRSWIVRVPGDGRDILDAAEVGEGRKRGEQGLAAGLGRGEGGEGDASGSSTRPRACTAASRTWPLRICMDNHRVRRSMTRRSEIHDQVIDRPSH